MLNESTLAAFPAPPPSFRPRGNSPLAGGWRIPIPRRSGERPVAPPRVPAVRIALSERDLLLVRRLAEGASTAQVAAALSVSTNTARTRIRRVMAKLSVPDRARLVPAVRELGLV